MSQVSIIMPVRNGEAYIAAAIASALAQGPALAEIIVIDDGSTDRTAAIVAGIGDPRIRLIASPQGGRGVSAARNLGVAAARAPFLHFLDADDILRPGALDALLAAADPAAIAVYGDYDRIDAEGRPIGRRRLLRRRRKPSGDIRRALLGGNFIVTGAILIRAEAFRAIGGFATDLRYGEDWHAWCRLAAQGPIRFVPGLQVVDYRIHASSTVAGRLLDLDDLMPAIDAVQTDPVLVAGLSPAERAALRRKVKAQKDAYCVGQALRTRRYAAGIKGLLAATLRSPRHAPRLWLVSGAALAGL